MYEVDAISEAYPRANAIRDGVSIGQVGAALEVIQRRSSNLQLLINQLFERFYTGSQARNQGGFGLGLAISRHLTEQMGSSMTVESRRQRTGNVQDTGMENGIWLVFKTVFKSCG